MKGILRTGVVLVVVLAVIAASGGPALAQDSPEPKPKRSALTIIKWTAIGVAAGFGAGFLGGFRAYEDAPYAEDKIFTAAVVGAFVGGAGGAWLGWYRSQPEPSVARGRRPVDRTPLACPTSLAELVRWHPARLQAPSQRIGER